MQDNPLARVEALLAAGETARALELLAALHPADQAGLIARQELEDREEIARALSLPQLGALLEYFDQELRLEVLGDLAPRSAAAILRRMDDDVVADIVQDFPPDKAAELTLLLHDSIQELISYPEQSAGGRMTTNFVALERDWNVDRALQFLRHEAPDDNHPFYVYVVDEARHLTGTVSLRRLVTAAPQTSIAGIARDEVISALVDEDQEAVAERMRRYNLLALPVVDEGLHLRGVVTADDVIDVLVEEATEDIYRMAGLAEEERIFRPLRQSLPPRLGWLGINLATALLAALVVSLFEGTIERVAVLAVFLPMVGAMAGNAGLQTLTLVVRSIALGEVETRDGFKVLRHEAAIALVNGLVIGSLVGLVAWLWQGNAWLGLIVGVALLANISNAVLGGVLVPFTLRRLNLDPALASGVIVTIADAAGFLIFLGLAALLVSRLT